MRTAGRGRVVRGDTTKIHMRLRITTVELDALGACAMRAKGARTALTLM